MKKVALITGVTGQDGALLAELLLNKGYEVHGVKRRASLISNTARVDHLYSDPHQQNLPFYLHYGDLTDTTNLIRLVQETQPTEIYNLAAQSHVAVSFETAEYTANADALGTLRLLEAIRILKRVETTKFYQASTSEMYGGASSAPLSELSRFAPRSPYAAAKLYAYWITVNYREAYGIQASNGILFNHESSIRGETFVTRKVTRGIARIIHGLDHCLYLGNLDARRDWGHARDYVRGMWMIMQHSEPDDFVLATGEARSVREFVEAAFGYCNIQISWKGKGADETGIDTKSDRVLVRVDPTYYRPTEVDVLVGDYSKAKDKLGWQPTVSFDELVREMVRSDLDLAGQEQKAGRASAEDLYPTLSPS